MEILDDRLNIILDCLQKNKLTTSQDLANYLNVSSRTVKSDISKLNVVIKKYGATVYSKRGCGYSLEIENQDLFYNFLKNIDKEEKKLLNIPSCAKERYLYLIRKLLMVDFPITIEELSDDVYVSRQTIQQDLKNVKIILENYDLSLKSCVEGVFIDGDEMLKRRCICDLFFLRNTEFFVCDNEMFSSDMNQEEIRFIREALLNVLNKFKLRFSDLSVQNMVIHIMIALRRYKFYQYVSFSDEKKDSIKNTVYFEAATTLKDLFEKQFKVVLPENEIIYLAMHIKSKVIIGRSDENSYISNEMDELLYRIYRRVNKKYNISLFFNQELNDLLKLHIPAMVDRIQSQLTMRNPLCLETLRRYQYAVEICLEVVDEIEKEYDIKIDKNEFAYLVLYFNLELSRAQHKNKQRIVLVCGRGRPETIQIMNQLNEKFNYIIDKIVTLDVYDLDTFCFYNQDILISTIPINATLPVPYIYVRGYIEDYYDEIYKTLLMRNLVDVNIKEVVHRVVCVNDVECETKEEVLDFLKVELSKGNVELAEEIIQNIYMDYSEIGNQCAILHTLSDCKEPTIIMIKLKHPILWTSQYVQDIYFINLKNTGTDIMKYVYDKISNLYDSEFTGVNKFEQLKRLIK